MSVPYDVTIVSIFNRGNWLASELSQQGYKVALIDLSHLMGRWTPSDWEGPFGIFKTTSLTESQIFFLFEGEAIVESSKGYVIWSKQGPIEFAGPLFGFQTDKGQLNSLVTKYLKNTETRSLAEALDLRGQIKKSHFFKTWPVHLSHQIASGVYYENVEAIDYTDPLPLFAPFSFRQASRAGLSESLASCEKVGVKVFEDAELLDAHFKDEKLESLEVSQKERSQIHSSNKWLWMLSGLESSVLKDKVKEQLHLQKPTEPDWAWVRYAIEFSPSYSLKALPPHFLMMDDIFTPWVHTNMMICNRTFKDTEMDVWLRIPHAQRFQRQYLEDLQLKIKKIFKDRLPDTVVDEIRFPQEYYYGFNEIGAPRFCVYDRKNVISHKRRNTKNLFWLTPEDTKRLDWTGFLQQQKDMVESLTKKEKEKDDR
jgi:hypothetical protein